MTASATACVACHVVYSAVIHHHRQAACAAMFDDDGNGNISTAASTNFQDDVEIFAKDTPFHRKVLEQANNSIESDGIRSERPWGLLNTHLASLLAQFRPSPFHFGGCKRRVTRRQERIALPIGDALDVEFFEPVFELTSDSNEHTTAMKDLPMVLLLHGINGHSTEPYIEQAAIQIVASRGWRCVVLNYSQVRVLQHVETVRVTLGGGSNFLDSGDLNFLISHLRKNHHGFLAAVGFSMGGAKLIQYLGRTGVHSNLDAACCVSSPLDFSTKNETVWRANSLMQRLYHLGMSSNLKWWLVRNYRALKAHPRLCTAKPFRRSVSGLLWWFQATRVTDFDEAITIHAKGYQDLDTYYSDATAIERLRFDVQVPFLCITAKNDPFIPSEILPGEDLAQDNEHVIVLNTTRLGGHIGFWLPGKGCWATRRFLSFFASVQEHMDLIMESSPACYRHCSSSFGGETPRELHRKNSLYAARNLQKTSSTKLTDYMQLVALDSVSSFGSICELPTEAEDADDDDDVLTSVTCSVRYDENVR
jgi:predicted alpha/beta-fold hydrolase